MILSQPCNCYTPNGSKEGNLKSLSLYWLNMSSNARNNAIPEGNSGSRCNNYHSKVEWSWGLLGLGSFA